VACFGPSRVMWGSDWPVLNLNGTYDDWFATAQTLTGASQQIFGTTAKTFYRIEET